MKSIILTIAFLAGILSTVSADVLKEALQKGLFEEEVNRNLPAAIEAYKAVIAEYEKDRQIAATAVFRLGESYRKLGRTNEAFAYYQRIVREFSDQAQLVEVSRKHLPPLPVAGLQQRLQEVVARGPEASEIQRIQMLIKNSPDLINARGTNGLAPLHEAAANGQLTVATYLLDNGAEINLKDKESKTPLHHATINGHKAMADLLLARGADVSARDSNGDTPLHNAAQQGYRLLTETLLDAKADLNARNANQQAPLHIVALRGNDTLIALLLDQGADPTLKDRKGNTPLHLAIMVSRNAGAMLLLERGAPFDVAGELNLTPLHLAVERDSRNIVDWLLERKVDVNVVDAQGRTPLLEALGRGRLELAEMLLKHGADPNQKGFVVDYGRIGFVTKNLDVSKAIMNLRFLKPLQLAVLFQNREMAELLLKHEADISVTHENGYTLLHWAVNLRDKELVELLLARGANPNAVASDGETPLSLARKRVKLTPFDPTEPQVNPLSDPRALIPVKIKKPIDPQEEKTLQEIAALLLRHGADEFLHRRSVISVSRQSAQFNREVFRRDSKGNNRFTLFELLAEAFSGSQPNVMPQELKFPDFSRVMIHRLKGNEITLVPVDLEASLKSADCSKDMWLEWGDVVEIPEADHKLGDTWQGLDLVTREVLQKCLARKMALVIKDQSYPLELKPYRAAPSRPAGIPATESRMIPTTEKQSMWMKDVVRNSGLLLASSDLSRVTVKRPLPGTDEVKILRYDFGSYELVFEDLWLRDGDVIEIPER